MLVHQDETMGDVMDRLRRRTNSIQLVEKPPQACPYFEVWEPETPMQAIDLTKPLRHLWLRWWGPAARDEPDRKFHFCMRTRQWPPADSEIFEWMMDSDIVHMERRTYYPVVRSFIKNRALWF